MDNRIASVQYLRALAALAVVAAHAGAHPAEEVFYLYSRLGQFGVTLFFVISGFIMVVITGSGRLAPLDFLRRRAIRIVPLYWIFTALAALLAVVAPGLFRSTVFTWPHLVESLAFIPHLAPGRGGTSPLLSLGWTLNYEAFFYICFALLASLLAWQRIAVLAVVFVGLAGFGLLFAVPTDGVAGFYANPILVAFVAGGGLGLLWLNGRFTRWSPGVIAGLLVLAVLAAVFAFALDTSKESLPSFLTLLLVCCALVGGGLALEGRLPQLRWLEKLGDASYAIYLIHMFVVGALVALVGHVTDPTVWYVGLGIVAASLLAASLAGLVVHRYLEQPLLVLLRGRRRKPAPTAQAA